MSDQELEPYVSPIAVQLVALSLAMRDHRGDLRWKRITRKFNRAADAFSNFAESKGARRRLDKSVVKLIALGNEFEILNNLVQHHHRELATEIIKSKVSKTD
jgi:hypothetical protein